MGSQFKAVNNRDKNFTRAKTKRRPAEVDASIERDLGQLDSANDAAPPDDTRPIQVKIAALTEEMDRLKKFEVRMHKAPDKQLSLTDPDARSMKSRGGGIVGYNVQTAVDTDSHLLVAHEVTYVGSDRCQLAAIATQAKAQPNADELHVLADRSDSRSEELLACEQADIQTYVSKPLTSNNKARGQFDRSDFQSVEVDDEYECPADQRLNPQG